MESAGVKKGRRGGAEATAFVEVVEADGPLLGLGFLFLEKAHGNAHPEELRGLDALMLVARFIDDEVAVVEGLDAEVVEIEVGGGIEGGGELVEIVFLQQIRVEALDGDAVLEVGLEALFVGLLELVHAIGRDGPIEDFLVDVGEQDSGGELREVGVLLDEGLRVEDDGGFEVFGGNFRANRAAEFALDLGLGEV